MSAKSKSKLSSRKSTQCVHLELARPNASEVCIAGSFNDWHPGATPMIRLSDGRWGKDLTLAPGRYEYRFVVDGQWMDDPAATEFIPNVFGSASAVLEVRAPAPAASLDVSSGANVTLPLQSRDSKPSSLKARGSRVASTSAVAIREAFPSLTLVRVTERS